MTVISVTTVGYGEVYPSGRLLTMFIVLAGTRHGGLLYGRCHRVLREGSMDDVLRRHRMRREIAVLKDHFIVCVGTGTRGSRVVLECTRALHSPGDA